MRDRCRSWMAIALLAAASPLAAQQRTFEIEAIAASEAADPAEESHESELVEDFSDRMTVEVRLGDRGPYSFLVDTGAERTVVSKELASELGLAHTGQSRVHSITGVAAVNTVAVPSLKVGGRQVAVARAPLLMRAHIGADGILGIDSLSAQRLHFDFQTGTLTVVPSRKFDSRTERDVIVVEAKRRSGRLVVARAKADGVPVTVVIDTGSQLSIANHSLHRALTRRRSLAVLGQAELLSVTGERLAGDYFMMRELDLGGVTLSGIPTMFATSHSFTMLGLNDRPAILLGMNALRGFGKLTIDFDRKQLRVMIPEDQAKRRLPDAQRLGG